MPAMSGFASLIVLQAMLREMLSQYFEYMKSTLVPGDSTRGIDCLNDGSVCAQDSRSRREERSSYIL